MLFEFETNIYDSPRIDLYDLDEGFTKGNMFRNLYDPYKNYKPNEIKPKNEQEILLDKIYKLCFALNDLNLYLDLNYNDTHVYEIFKKYALMYEKYLEEYEKKYQVLNLTHDVYDKYTWYKNPWPWEGKYV